MTSRPPRITEADVGGFFVRDDGTIWRLVGYAASPTATLEQIHPAPAGERLGGVVGAPIFEGFRRLIPESADG